MASLFISYSRKDIDAARKLTEALKGPNLDFWIDWEGIPPTVDWWREIEKGIEETDFFLFLLSPDSAGSKVCRQEIQHAVKNGKRLIPIVVRTTPASEAPPELRPLNWIYLREEDNFRAGFSKVIQSIKTDFAWAQAHRQLLVKALEWERGGHKNDLLLHGEELREAELQLATNSSKEPRPTDLQREYVLRSRQSSDRRRRRTTGIVIAGMIALVILAVFGLVQAERATNNAATAVANQAEAERQATIALSRQLAAQAQTELLGNQDRRLSVLLAIEALNAAGSVPGFQNVAAEQVLRDAMYQTGGEVLVSPASDDVVNNPFGSTGTTVVKALSPSGQWLAIAYQDNTIHLWKLGTSATPPEILVSSTKSLPNRLLFDPTERFLVGLGYEEGLQIWDLKKPRERSRMVNVALSSWSTPIFAGHPTFSPDGQWLAVQSLGAKGIHTKVINLSNPEKQPLEIPGAFRVAPGVQDRWLIAVEDKEFNSAAQLWDLHDPGKGPTPIGTYACQNFLVSPDGRWLATRCIDTVTVWDIGDPAQPKTLSGPLQGYGLGAFSADSTRLALSNRSGLDVLDLRSGKQGFRLQSDGQPLGNVRFSPDGRSLAASSGSGSILLWDLRPATRTPIPTVYQGLGGIEYAVEFFEFASDSLHIVSVSDDGVTRKWDLSNPYSSSVALSSNGRELPHVDTISFSPDSRWLAMQYATGLGPTITSTLFDVQNFSAGPVSLPRLDGPLFFDPSGEHLILVSVEESQIHRWRLADLLNGKFTPDPLQIPGKIISSNLETPWLISQREDNTLHVLNLFEPDGQAKALVPDRRPLDTSTRMLSNGKWFWMFGKDSSSWLWDLEMPGNPSVSLPSPTGELYTIKLSPAGNWLAVTEKHTARVWDLRKSALEPILSIQADDGFGINSHNELQFSSDEHWLVVSQGTKIQLLDLQAPTIDPITLGGVIQEMREIAISPDGHWLVASSMVPPFEVRLWNLQDVTLQPRILQQEASSYALAFSPDGTWLAVSDSSTTRLWRMDPSELMKLGCDTVGSNLSRRQWAENFPPAKEYQPTCPQWPEGKDKIVKPGAG